MFSESLEMHLVLKIKGDEFKIPGGNIQAFEASLHTWGFEGRILFGVFGHDSKDAIFDSFISQDPLFLSLSVIRTYNHRDKDPEPIEINAYALRKAVSETTYKTVKKDPVLMRMYEVVFSDIPQALWRQHQPVKLYTDKKISDLLKDQVVEGISFDVDKDVVDEKKDIYFLGLAKRPGGPDYYDFLCWYVKEANACLAYDYKDQTLRLSAGKTAPEPDADFMPGEVAQVTSRFPETLRWGTRILNAHSETAEILKLDQDQAVKGIYRDIVIRTPIQSQVDEIEKCEKSKLSPDLETLELSMAAFPSKNLTIGSMVKFDKKLWTKNTLLADKKFRVFSIGISARAEGQDLSTNYNAPVNAFNMTMDIRLEHEKSPQVRLPGFKNPGYPVYVEGKIVSESGGETDKTYQVYTDEQTSQEYYSVHIPLWDMKVKAPFIPGVYTGHFYFPAFKNARVRLALFFDRARIQRFLDWGEGARLPMDVQGNHILFGNNDTSETSVQYFYSEGKPVFSIKRTSEIDTETIRMEEESIIIETKDDE